MGHDAEPGKEICEDERRGPLARKELLSPPDAEVGFERQPADQAQDVGVALPASFVPEHMREERGRDGETGHRAEVDLSRPRERSNGEQPWDCRERYAELVNQDDGENHGLAVAQQEGQCVVHARARLSQISSTQATQRPAGLGRTASRTVKSIARSAACTLLMRGNGLGR